MATQDKCCTIVPYFKVHGGKLEAFKMLCERFVEKTNTEPKCLFYGFSFHEDQVHCREGKMPKACWPTLKMWALCLKKP